MHNKSLSTKTLYIHCFDINTAVTCSTDGADTLCLLPVGKEDKHHSIPNKKIWTLQAASTHISSWRRCGNWVWYWISARPTNKARRIWNMHCYSPQKYTVLLSPQKTWAKSMKNQGWRTDEKADSCAHLMDLSKIFSLIKYTIESGSITT